MGLALGWMAGALPPQGPQGLWETEGLPEGRAGLQIRQGVWGLLATLVVGRPWRVRPGQGQGREQRTGAEPLSRGHQGLRARGTPCWEVGGWQPHQGQAQARLGMEAGGPGRGASLRWRLPTGQGLAELGPPAGETRV